MTESLTTQQQEHLFWCKSEFTYFLKYFGWLQKQSASEDAESSWIKFKMDDDYEYTFLMAHTLQHAKYRYVNDADQIDEMRGANIVWYKSRQMGGTWLIDAFALWFVLFHQDRKVIIRSMTEPDGIQHISNIGGMLKQMQEHGQAWMIGEIKTREKYLEFERSGSIIEAITSTGRGGRSKNAAIVILDEFAYYGKDDAEAYESVSSTTREGGRIICISTPKLGSKHEEIAFAAHQGSIAWDGTTPPDRPKFWYPGMVDEVGAEVPFERDRWMDWYKKAIKWDNAYKTHRIDEHQWPVGQNTFLRVPLHFSVSSRCQEDWAKDVFWRVCSGNIQSWARDYYLNPFHSEAHVFNQRSIDGCYLEEYQPWGDPYQQGQTILLGVDMAEGGDNVAICALDLETGLQVNAWAKPLDIVTGPHEVCKEIDYILACGATPWVIIENNRASAIIYHILSNRDDLVRYCYRHEDHAGRDVRMMRSWYKGTMNLLHVGKIGFPMGEKTKRDVITQLSNYLMTSIMRDIRGNKRYEQPKLRLTDGPTVSELRHYIYKADRNGVRSGKMGCPNGKEFRDDRVMALALAVIGMGSLDDSQRGTRNVSSENINYEVQSFFDESELQDLALLRRFAGGSVENF